MFPLCSFPFYFLLGALLLGLHYLFVFIKILQRVKCTETLFKSDFKSEVTLLSVFSHDISNKILPFPTAYVMMTYSPKQRCPAVW